MIEKREREREESCVIQLQTHLYGRDGHERKSQSANDDVEFKEKK